MKSRKILVTGASGFVGIHLVAQLLENNERVVALGQNFSHLRSLKDKYPSVELVACDIRNKQGVFSAIRHMNLKGIFHLAAAIVTGGKAMSDEEMVRTNLLGLINLHRVTENIDYDFFIQVGSFFEYGIHNKPVKENASCVPIDINGVTKLSATAYGQFFAKVTGKPVVTARLFTPYGPGIQKNKLVYKVIAQALANQTIKMTNKRNTRDFIFIDDAVTFLTEIANKASRFSGEVFNMGSGRAVTFEKLVRDVLRKTGSESTVHWGALEGISNDEGFWQADMNKVYRNLSWRPQHSLKEGLQKTIDWIKLEHVVKPHIRLNTPNFGCDFTERA